MKITITDACIFIDLYNLELLKQFFDLELEIHTTKDVFEELYDYQQEALSKFIYDGKLTIHALKSADWIELASLALTKSLSKNDQTVLYLAIKLNAFVLSSDNLVRKMAKANAIEYHGMLWILDELLSLNIIDNNIAMLKLESLVSHNQTYRNNSKLMQEIALRMKKWRL